ncbi:YqhA family protein [Methanosarcina sp.]|uniref:YqhA family protein n=1 Tax=Methanosarcina sp. TaxID=2213 RepID=UPI003C70DCA9
MRFFVLIPVIGLAVAADVLFIKGGIDLVHFLWELVSGMQEADTQGSVIVELVEIVHLFLVGTVLFLTSLGLYELFIQSLPLPEWLRTHNIEELELNLVGLTVVVLAVNFLSVIFEPQEINLAVYGIGYALPIAALAYFMKVRSSIKGSEKESRTASREESSEGSEPAYLPLERIN